MWEQLPWWIWPFVAALILISIHTYLGLHVIARKVLFVDLALAQITALGGTVAFLFGFELADSVTFYVSLSFGVVGAWLFSVTRVRGDRVPQEAIIGLSFAIASALSILLSAENPHGAEHLRDILAGSILVVTPAEVRNAALLYAAIGALHWVLRRQFMQISIDPEGAAREGLAVRRWDFAFYVSFALVITLSVHIAGVLLVFCFLIAPAVCAALFTSDFKQRLFIGWGTSVLAASGGLVLSARFDWPPAPSIIGVYAAVLIGAGILSSLRYADNRARALLRVALGSAAFAAAVYGMVAFLSSDLAHSFQTDDAHAPPAPPAGTEAQRPETPRPETQRPETQRPETQRPETQRPETQRPETPRPETPRPEAPRFATDLEHGHGTTSADLLAALKDEHDSVRASAAEGLGKTGDRAHVTALLEALDDPSIAVREKAAEALGAIADPSAAPRLEAALAVASEDEWVRLRVAAALVRCGGTAGMRALLELAARGDARVLRHEALRIALLASGRAPLENASAEDAAAALETLEAWWKGAERNAHWDPATGRFVERP
ncbi:MAG: metal ABC transporter permease [Deltaproteobacteria bacterium]|nr:metal ABC transporter permease [Deltaproteobacteria bacterium]